MTRFCVRLVDAVEPMLDQEAAEPPGSAER